MEINYQLKVDKAQIAYRLIRDQAQKPLITLIHGLASNCTRFTEFVNNTSLKESWDLLRIDLRGHGDSMYRGYYDRNTWCNDLLAVLNKERYPQTIIIGHSLGAQVALNFALQHPDRVRGLVLIDPIFPENLHGALGRAKRFRLLISAANIVLRFLNKIGIKRWRIPKRDLYQLDLETRQTLAANKDLTIGELYTNPLADLKYLPIVNYLQDIVEVVRKLPDLSDISQPALVLLSKGASISSFDKTKAFIDRIPDNKLVVIEADHWLLTEKPDEAREIIEQWCSKMSPDYSQ